MSAPREAVLMLHWNTGIDRGRSLCDVQYPCKYAETKYEGDASPLDARSPRSWFTGSMHVFAALYLVRSADN